MLIAQAHGSAEIISTIVFTAGLAGLLGVSALYHRPHWSIDKRKWMRRLDHSMIFVLIASTFTPVCLLVLSPATGIKLLGLTWIVALAGVLQTLVWTKMPKWLASFLYVGFGWMIVPHLAELRSALGSETLTMLFWGGVSYTVGAIIYALKRPNPSPRIFGYHEIFHALVILGAVFHFIMVAQIVGN